MDAESTLWTILGLYLLMAGVIGGLLPTWPLSVTATAAFALGILLLVLVNEPEVSWDLAQFLIAIASNDDQRSPSEKNVLKETFENAKLAAEIEVYSGAHGWCPPDSRVHNEPDAEKAWARLLALYGKALA